jgi:L-threonylcarbamoyladenylate synthase
MERHWPGPLTLVLPAAPGMPDALTAGTGTIGIRMPGHPVALGLVKAARRPVTAPSANPSGEAPAATAEAVLGYFDGAIDLILDAGATAGGPGSTVADCTVWPPRVLRQGAIRIDA